MPKFKVERSTALNAKETFAKLKDFLDKDPGLRKLDSEYKCNFNDSKMTGSAKGGQFSAELTVTEGSSGAQVVIEVDLPLMLTPFKGKVKGVLEHKLEKLLA